MFTLQNKHISPSMIPLNQISVKEEEIDMGSIQHDWFSITPSKYWTAKERYNTGKIQYFMLIFVFARTLYYLIYTLYCHFVSILEQRFNFDVSFEFQFAFKPVEWKLVSFKFRVKICLRIYKAHYTCIYLFWFVLLRRWMVLRQWDGYRLLNIQKIELCHYATWEGGGFGRIQGYLMEGFKNLRWGPFELNYLTYLKYSTRANGEDATERRLMTDIIWFPASILYKSIAGRYRPVRVADGPMTARYRFM